MQVIISRNPQVIVRVARRTHQCDCHLREHNHAGEGYGFPGVFEPSHWCENVIQAGEEYPEYLGESAAYQSGTRYCPACRKDQLGDWIIP